MFGEYEGGSPLDRRTIEEPTGAISMAIAISWLLANATISWAEKNVAYCRIATRSPPGTGEWGEIPSYKELRAKYECNPNVRAPGYWGVPWESYSGWYKSDEAAESLRQCNKSDDHGSNVDLATQVNQGDRGDRPDNDPKVRPWCDQG